MSDISNQLIKDSYNYVLQSDLATGIVYRIGGVIPVNPIFQSAITVNSGFTYTNGTEQPNYVLTTDGTGYSFWAPVSGTSPYLPLSGGTVTGNTVFTSGLTANTISAATYQNLPKDIFVTGGTYTNGEITFINNSGGTFTVTGLPIGGAGGQVYYLNLSNTQSPYQEFSPIGTTVGEQTTAVTISDGVTSTIASFQTPTGYPNTTLIPAGYWSFYLHSYKGNSNASFNIFCEIYLRTTGGTETLLVTTDPAPVTTDSPNPSMQLSDGYYSGSSINENDRLVVKVRATNTSNQTHSITFLTEGTQHYSYGITPFTNDGTLTCDNLSGCSIIQTIQTDISNKFDKSGGTITGDVLIQNGLTANTISATTYQNLPQNLSYYVSGSTPGGSHISGDRWLNTTSGDELVWVNDGDSQQWIQISSIVGGGNSNSSIVIASSNCNIISDGAVYISNSKFGWSYFDWGLDVSSYDRSLIFSIIPIPKKLGEGQTISVYGVAYSGQLDSEYLRGYIYIVNCDDLDTLSPLYDSGWNQFSVDGNLCFNFEYTLSPGESYTEYVNFISIGFGGASSGNGIRISWSIKIN